MRFKSLGFLLAVSLAVVVGHDGLMAQQVTGASPTGSEPSLKQTLDWLSGNLWLFIAQGHKERFEATSFQGCTLVWRSQKLDDSYLTELMQQAVREKPSKVKRRPRALPGKWSRFDGKGDWHPAYEVSVNLADLDPTLVEASFIKDTRPLLREMGPWSVWLETTDKKEAIRQTEVSENGVPIKGKYDDFFGIYAYSFNFSDEESALRVAKAFRHAIELCGGKKSQTPPDEEMFVVDPEWKRIGQDMSFRLYYYTKTVRRTTLGTIEVWVKQEVADKSPAGRKKVIDERNSSGLSAKGYEKYAHTMVLQEYDCSSGQMRGLSATDYDEAGAVLWTGSGATQWHHLVPDSMGDIILRTVCKAPQ